MPSLKKDLFNRGPRFTHRFDELTNDDFIGTGTFNLPLPDGIKCNGTAPILKKNQGQHDYCRPLSPVVKPSGVRAQYDGPQVDYAEQIAYQTPAGTKKRKSMK